MRTTGDGMIHLETPGARALAQRHIDSAKSRIPWKSIAEIVVKIALIVLGVFVLKWCRLGLIKGHRDLAQGRWVPAYVIYYQGGGVGLRPAHCFGMRDLFETYWCGIGIAAIYACLAVSVWQGVEQWATPKLTRRDLNEPRVIPV